jgi:hypothetical protein
MMQEDVDQLLNEAYSKVRSGQATQVTIAKAKTEPKRKSPEGVKEPKDGPGESATDGDPKNVKNLMESESEPNTPLLVNEEDSSNSEDVEVTGSAFEQLANSILNSTDDDLVNENYEEEISDLEDPEISPDDMVDDIGGSETVEVSVADLEALRSLVDTMLGTSDSEEIIEEPAEVPMTDEDEIPQESKATHVGGVVGKKPHPLTGATPTNTATKGPKAKSGASAKSFAPTAPKKGADKPRSGHVVVKNRKSPGDPLFSC